MGDDKAIFLSTLLLVILIDYGRIIVGESRAQVSRSSMPLPFSFLTSNLCKN